MSLNVDYFYSLTPRQFQNIQIGWMDRREAESRERILLTRKVMFAALAPWGKGLTEDKIWPLDFEKQIQSKSNQKSERQMQIDLDESLKFWARIDAMRSKKSEC